MTESMQMDLNLYLGFPWSCEHASFQDCTHNAYGDQTAFWCAFPHRIIEEECMGMKCPHCKVRKAEDIARIMSSMGKVTQ